MHKASMERFKFYREVLPRATRGIRSRAMKRLAFEIEDDLAVFVRLNPSTPNLRCRFAICQNSLKSDRINVGTHHNDVGRAEYPPKLAVSALLDVATQPNRLGRGMSRNWSQ